jgi:signal transduction histidine kinase
MSPSTRPLDFRSSFQYRLFRVFTLLTALIALIFLTVYTITEIRNQREHLSAQLHLQAQHLAETIRLPLYAENRPVLRELAEGATHQIPKLLGVVITASNGKVLANVQLPGSENKADLIEETVDVRSDPLASSPESALSGGIDSAPILIGKVTLKRSTDDLLLMSYRLVMISCAVAVGFWLTVCLICYLVLRQVTKSYNALMQGIQTMQSGDLSTRINVVSDDEPGRAAHAVNELADALAVRTSELENANRELEAFNYSVSHDLRKPLTVIYSYCELIREFYSHTLDAQFKTYLQEISDGSQRMNQLIDSLLEFASITRTQLHRGNVNLSEIAHTVATELVFMEPGRRVTFRVSDGITVNGDRNLLQVVMDNLLGNAWKYTAKKEEAIIEFGMLEDGGMPTYYVRDNGSGFDMAHADKLFVPFQRLHVTDTNGHGIGLATVERIIKRHGGQVWAEGEPEKGSTFYFTC